MGMTGDRFLGRAGLMSGGLLVWAVHFGFVYGYVALICARGLEERTAFGVEIALLGVALGTVAALALAAVMVLVGWRGLRAEGPAARFVAVTAMATGLLGALAIVWNALPAFLVPVCA